MYHLNPNHRGPRFNAPNVVRNPGLHGWGDSQGLVNPAEIVILEVNGDRVRVIFDLL
jgi:hypothetical protein